MSIHAVVVAEPATVENAGFHREEEAICRLAHELRQPLSTIEAIAYYLEITLPADQFEARRYLTRLRKTVEESNAILIDALRETQTKPLNRI
jgi:signal transduction histidine kinase